MGKKTLGSRSGNAKRQIAMAFTHVRDGKSLSQAINAVPGLSMSRNGLSKQWKKHQEGSSLPAPARDRVTKLGDQPYRRVCSCFVGEETSKGSYINHK